MSSARVGDTSKMKPRDGRDFYATRPGVVRAGLAYLAALIDPPRYILDVGSGTGIWGIEARRIWPKATIWGIDKYFKIGPPEYDSWWLGDFMTADYGDLTFDLVMGNPPFKLQGTPWKIEDIILKSWGLTRSDGTMLFYSLQSLMGSDGRGKNFWPRLLPQRHLILTPRPGHVGYKGTDYREYMLTHWIKGKRPPSGEPGIRYGFQWKHYEPKAGQETQVIRRRSKRVNGRKRVNIGRPAKWGNPFPMNGKSPEERARVIAEYERWIMGQPVLLASLHELAGADLACPGACAPRPCHGDVLKRLADQLAQPMRISWQS